jgi:ketosteroid isomerase-like protein
VILDRVQSERFDIVTRGIEAYNRGDQDALAEFVSEDMVAVVPDGMANAGVYHGPEGFRQMMAGWDEAWEEFTVDVEELVEEGDALIAQVLQYGRGRGSGIETRMHAFYVLHVRDGRLCGWRWCQSREEALRHARE